MSKSVGTTCIIVVTRTGKRRSSTFRKEPDSDYFRFPPNQAFKSQALSGAAIIRTRVIIGEWMRLKSGVGEPSTARWVGDNATNRVIDAPFTEDNVWRA